MVVRLQVEEILYDVAGVTLRAALKSLQGSSIHATPEILMLCLILVAHLTV